jgi:hypothetical protein
MKSEAAEHIEAAVSGSKNVFLILKPPFELILSSNPDKEELYKHLIGDMLELSHRDHSLKIIFHLNPWLKEVPTTPR